MGDNVGGESLQQTSENVWKRSGEFVVVVVFHPFFSALFSLQIVMVTFNSNNIKRKI